MNFLAQLNKSASFQKIVKILAPHTKKAYLVGGSVRDLILNISPKDFDIEVFGLNKNEFEALMKNIGAIGVGKSFFVYKYGDIDLSLPRTECKVAPTHTGFKVQICCDEKQASLRRDFSMNALMLNIFTGELKDFHEGLKDIKHKTIRLVSEKSFKQDSLRALRAVRFSSQFGFVIEKNTASNIKEMSLKELSKQRIFWELEKIFLSSYPEIGVLNLHKLGLLKQLLNSHESFEKIFKIAQKIRYFYDYKTPFLQPFITLFILLHELNLDIKLSLKKLQTPKIYENILLKSPYKLLPLSDQELAQIALKIPLKNWVGICQKNLVKRAKNLGIYHEVFTGGVKTEDILKEGFRGKQIGLELEKRKMQIIRQNYG